MAVERLGAVEVTDRVDAPGDVVQEEDADYIASRHTGVVIKRLEDLWLKSAIDTTILRCGGLYGKDRKPGRFLKNRPLTKPGKPVNMTHINDVVKTVNKIIDENHFGDVFNVVSINRTSRKEFYQKFRDELVIEDGEATSYKIVSREKLETQLGLQFGDS